MNLEDLKEPDLSKPEEFMHELFMVAQNLYGDAVSHNLKFGGYINSYPHISFNPTKKVNEIFVSQNCKEIKEALAFEMSHEVFHALMPSSPLPLITILEEGMATDFSFLIMDHFGYPYEYFWKKKTNLDYQYAVKLVKNTRINNPEIIKQIRKIQPGFTSLIEEDILKVIKLTPGEVDNLLGDFYLLA
jgi:hypothetical protein